MKAKQVNEFIQKKSLKNSIGNDIGINKIIIDDIFKWLKNIFHQDSQFILDDINITIDSDNYFVFNDGLIFSDYLLKNPNELIEFPFNKIKIPFLIFNKTKIKKLPENIITNELTFNLQNNNVFKFPEYLECNKLIFEGVFELGSFFNENLNSNIIIHKSLYLDKSYTKTLPKINDLKYVLIDKLSFYEEILINNLKLENNNFKILTKKDLDFFRIKTLSRIDPSNLMNKQIYEFVQKKSLKNSISNEIGINKKIYDEILKRLQTIFTTKEINKEFEINPKHSLILIKDWINYGDRRILEMIQKEFLTPKQKQLIKLFNIGKLKLAEKFIEEHNISPEWVKLFLDKSYYKYKKFNITKDIFKYA